MSTADDFPFSVAQQKALISADLNSTLLFQLLFGIYTGIFAATVHIYVRKENRTRTRDTIIIGSTTALYLLTAVTTGLNWLYTNVLLGTHGATRVEIFLESVIQGDIPVGEEIIEDVTIFFGSFFLADGLLVWRCFHACGQSFRKSAFPVALFTVETILALATAVYRSLLDAKPDFEMVQTDQIFDRLSAAAYVTVAATSLVSTIVICLQIWRHTMPRSRSRKNYRNIINILIQSSAIYTVTVLFSAVLNFTSDTGSGESSFASVLISNFVAPVTQIVSGLVPTLMIARLFVSSSQEDREVSSARLPSDLIDRAAHATCDNIINAPGADLEMQREGTIGAVGQNESEEIRMVGRAEYQLKNDVEDRPTSFV
ncbi:hypothetical protein CPC08DRAFT_823132 [Agrocybe pediades]|nr:hypothetical protein CPC08DRAFT_823132 [Agrocybe pediades]